MSCWTITAPSIVCRRVSRRSAVARGFTLTELIVAVGAVALLTIGIGQIFSSVSRLVGTGAAIAESDQMARSLEAQLRNDFEALSGLREEDTFFAIRSRRVRLTYLTQDERDSDSRAGFTPLPSDPGPNAKSRRLDEMMFLGLSEGTPTMQTIEQGRLDQPVVAPITRIYYGHALRPMLDPLYDPTDLASPKNVPERQWLPDGDFAQRAGETNRFQSGVQVTGRNEYAGDWILARHALLLFGAEASGPAAGTGGNVRGTAPANLLYTPYAREREARTRFGVNGIDDLNPSNWPQFMAGSRRIPWPRLISHGRVDVCAQSPETLKRWLEGREAEPASPGPNWAPGDASAFDGGWNNSVPAVPPPSAVNQGERDSPLWIRQRANAANIAIESNREGLQAAIAGMFTRIMAESDPPFIDRSDSPVVTGAPATNPNPDPPMSALMDIRSTIGTRCSNFEIAWSTGETWLDAQPYSVVLPNGEALEFEQGDLVWFDFDFHRRDERSNLSGPRNHLRADGRQPLYAALPTNQIAEYVPSGTGTINRDVLKSPAPWGGTIAYEIDSNATAALTNDAAQEPEDEYLAIWGYRTVTATPDGPGSFLPSLTKAWPKPKLIRVRMTLHDAQFRLDGGRKYEFIFAVNLRP